MPVLGKRRYTNGPAAYAPAPGGGASLSAPTLTDTYFKSGTPAPGVEETCDIGTASSDRIVVVSVYLRAAADSVNADFTCKINNNAATQAVYDRAARNAIAIFYLNVTTGTTATVEIDGYTNGWVDSYDVRVSTFTGSAGAVGTADVTNAIAAGNHAATAVAVETNGVTIMVGYSDTISGPATHAWTNATEYATDYVTANGGTMTGAYITAGATVTLTAYDFNVSGWLSAKFAP